MSTGNPDGRASGEGSLQEKTIESKRFIIEAEGQLLDKLAVIDWFDQGMIRKQ